jgi:stress-induced-phosphoprotein 1
MSTAAELKAQGVAAYSAKDYPAAIAAFSAAIDLSPPDAHLLLSNRAAVYTAAGDYDNAILDGEKLTTEHPSFSKGWIRLSTALRAAGRVKSAIETLEAGVQAIPGDAAIEKALADAKKEADSAVDNIFGNLFGPSMWAKLAENPKTAQYLSDPSFVQMLQKLQTDPNTMTECFADPRFLEAFTVISGVPVSVNPDAVPQQAEPAAPAPPLRLVTRKPPCQDRTPLRTSGSHPPRSSPRPRPPNSRARPTQPTRAATLLLPVRRMPLLLSWTPRTPFIT